MGISFDQTAASVASLTLAGFSADKAVTGMQSVFTNLSKPTTTGAAALQKVGLTYAGIRDEIKNKGLLPALVDMNKAFDGNQVALRQVFSSGKAIVPFLALTGKAAGKTSGVFKDLANSTGASNKAFADAVEDDGVPGAEGDGTDPDECRPVGKHPLADLREDDRRSRECRDCFREVA